MELGVYILCLLFLIACGYQLFATLFARRFAERGVTKRNPRLKFSQIKPLRTGGGGSLRSVERFVLATEGLPHDFYVCCPETPPAEWSERWPQVTWLTLKASQERNGKAATLALGERYWSGDIFVISDSDMICDSLYLEAVLGEFSDPKVGVVTCLYRACDQESLSAGGLLESLFMLDFAASVLVAESTEGVSFAMGSTMAVRRETLKDIGGFEALEPYLADDFQLGYKASKKGWKVALAPTVLDTKVGTPTLLEALSHQYRWMVTSKVSRPFGYLAFIVTQGLLWASLLCLLAPAKGLPLLCFWLGVRILAGGMQNLYLRRKESTRTRLWEALFLPLKDVLFLILWTVSLRGQRVLWGDRELEVDREGQILKDRRLD